MSKKLKLTFLIVTLLLLIATLTAACNSDTYTVTFVVDGGTYKSVTVQSGKTVTAFPAEPVKNGYYFDAWYFDNDVWTQPFGTTTAVISDVTVYAHWLPVPVAEARTFTVTFDSMGGSAVNPLKVTEGKAFTLPRAPERTDYNFDGWFLDKGYSVEFTESYEVKGDLTVYAKWTEVDSAIYFSHSGGVLNGITEQGKKVTVLTLPDELDGVKITSVAEGLFEGNTNLTKVTVPTGYDTLGARAFKDCTALKTVELANSVVNIGAEAFSGCTSIENLQLSTELTAVPDKLCYGCTSLKYFNAGGAATIGEGAYYGCTSLTSVALSQNVTSIGKEAFRDCTSIVTVNMREGLVSIGEGAFRNLKRLLSVTVPDSVTSLGAYAFYGCSAATSLKVGAGVTELNAYTFYGMNKVVTPEFAGEISSIGDCCFMGMSSMTSFAVPSTVTSLGSSVFYNCSSLTSVTLPQAISAIPEKCFVNCVKLNELDLTYITSIGASAFSDCVRYEAVLPASLTSIGASAFYGCKAITAISVPEGVTSIPESAFMNCTSLESVELHDEITAIGKNAFSGCTALLSVTLPEALTNIADRSFAYCTSLTGVTVGANVNAISSTAFTGCIALESLDVSAANATYASVNGVLFTDDSTTLALYPYGKKDTEYVVPEGVKYIAASVFYDNLTLTKVTLPSTLTEIGASAFYGCKNLATVNFPAGLKKIGSCAFYACNSLTEAVLPVGIVRLDAEAFRECGKLEKAVLPATLVSVGARVFRGAPATLEIDVDLDVTLLSGWSGAWDDTGKTGVKYNITYSAAHTVIDDYECALRDGKIVLTAYLGTDTVITVPETLGGYPVIGLATTYEGNESITEVTVPDTIEVITERTFRANNALTKITLPFAGAYRDAVGAEGLFGYIFDYSETRYSGWSEHYAEGGAQSKYYCDIPSSVKTVVLTDCETLAYGAFNNTEITSLTLPDGLKTIKTYALYDVPIARVYIPASVETIGQKAIALTNVGGMAYIDCAAEKASVPEGWADGWYEGSDKVVTVSYGVSRS